MTSSSEAGASTRAPWGTVLGIAGVFAAAQLVMRVDFVLWRDLTQVHWRASGWSLSAGALHDLGVGTLVAAALHVRPAWAPAMRAWGLGAFVLVALLLTQLNLLVIGEISAPLDWSMAGYVLDLATQDEIVAPVDVPLLATRLVVLIVATLAWWRWCAAGHRRRPLPVWSLAVAAVLLIGARVVAAHDYRAEMVAHADGASWLLQSDAGWIGDHGKADVRAAWGVEADASGEVFVDDRYPLARAHPHGLCRMGLRTEGCDADADADGLPLQRDCDDTNAAIRPGAVDTPRDGVDQDCDGLDQDAPDVLIVQLEGLPARLLPETGGDVPDAAPAMRALAHAEDARLFRRYETAGTQTARGFVSAMCSLMDHWGAMVTRDSPSLRVRCLPAILREVGYRAEFAQNGNPAFDQQGAFALHMGFADIKGANEIGDLLGVHDRPSAWGLADEALFAYLSRRLEAQRRGSAPLLLVAQTITNHYPYVVPGAPPAPKGAPERTMWQKLQATSRYVDDQLGAFIERTRALQRGGHHRPLLVLLAGDHGHASEQHPGNTMPTSGLFGENVHTPLLIWAPARPELLRRFDGADLDAPASGLDLLPTVLGVLGVRTLHASMGRDLARPAAERAKRAISMNVLAGGLVRVRATDATVISRAWPRKDWLFAPDDVAEQHDLAEEDDVDEAWLARRDALVGAALDAVLSAKRLIDADLVVPPLPATATTTGG